MDDRPIGVFDSGVGGLTVVSALSNALPNESIYYVGDTARVPYGNKSTQRIQQYSHEIAEWLMQKNCKMIVVACNTVSSLAMDYLQSHFPLPIIGVIQPGVDFAIQITKNNKIGVIGTQATIQSNAYVKALHSIMPDIRVISKACPLFVPLAEEGIIDGDIPLAIAGFYLKDIQSSDIDTVILGCTHYPLLKKVIGAVLGSRITLIDSGNAIARAVTFELDKHNLISTIKKGGTQCFVTDDPKYFDVFSSKFLQTPITQTQHIDLS